MNDFLKGRNAAATRDLSLMSPALDWDQFPALSTFLNGQGSPDGKTQTLPNHSLTIWCDGPLVKVCIGAGDEHPKGYYSFDSIESLLDKVEKALMEGKVDWKKVKAGWQGFTPKNR